MGLNLKKGVVLIFNLLFQSDPSLSSRVSPARMRRSVLDCELLRHFELREKTSQERRPDDADRTNNNVTARHHAQILFCC